MEPREDEMHTNPLFGSAEFAFPKISDDATGEHPGWYQVLLDVMYLNTSGYDFDVLARMSHEIGHRMLAVDNLSARVARHMAGIVYSFIWYLLGRMALYKVTLVGRGKDIRVADAKYLNDAIESIHLELGFIRDFNRALNWGLDNVNVVYELVATELTSGCLRGDTIPPFSHHMRTILRMSRQGGLLGLCFVCILIIGWSISLGESTRPTLMPGIQHLKTTSMNWMREKPANTSSSTRQSTKNCLEICINSTKKPLQRQICTNA